MVALADPADLPPPSAPLPKTHSITISPVTAADLPAITECELLAFDGTDAVGALLTPLRPRARRVARAPAPLARVRARAAAPCAPAARGRRAARQGRDRTGCAWRGRGRKGDEGGGLREAAPAAGGAARADVAGARAGRLRVPRRGRGARARRARRGRDGRGGARAVPGTTEGGKRGGHGRARLVYSVRFPSRFHFDEKKTECRRRELLVVHPDCQRRGVGAALLAHCTALADAAGVPMLLESSQVGRALYASRGFERVRMSRMEYGGAVASWPVMVREPVVEGKAAELGLE